MLDQGQTITIDTVAQVYNLTTFDKYRTERTGTLANGQPSKVNIDHTPGKGSANHRHLNQYVEDHVDSVSGVAAPLTINITISHPAHSDKTRIADCLAGFATFVETNIARTLNNES
jgi:hypothetical protein